MNLSLHRLWVCLPAFVLLCAAVPAGAQDRLAEAVNRSAHTQMLAERITRTYAMLGQSVIPARTKRQLDADIVAFEADLKALAVIPMNPEQKENLALLGQTWGELKAVVTKPATLAGAKTLTDTSEELAYIADKNITLLRKGGASLRSDAVVLAGAARTLSQRMAKLYFYRTWGLKTEAIVNDLKAAEEEYRVSMRKLATSPQNDDSIRADLALADSQWVFFSQALTRLGTGEAKMQSMDNVGKTSDALLDVLESLARKYEASKS